PRRNRVVPGDRGEGLLVTVGELVELRSVLPGHMPRVDQPPRPPPFTRPPVGTHLVNVHRPASYRWVSPLMSCAAARCSAAAAGAVESSTAAMPSWASASPSPHPPLRPTSPPSPATPRPPS